MTLDSSNFSKASVNLDPKIAIVDMVKQGRIIQAFDLALSQHIDPSVPEYQRTNDYKRLVQKLLLVNGGVEWDTIPDDNTLADDCLDVLADSRYAAFGITVVACLLKIIGRSQNVEWIHSGKWRPKIIQYLEKSLAKDFQKYRRVNFTKLSHEVMAELEDAVRNIERGITDGTSTFTSLSRLNAHRNTIMQKLSRADAWSLFGPFLPSQFQAQLSEAYERTEDYFSQRDNPDALDHFEHARTAISRFCAECNDFGTEYSRLFAQLLGKSLRGLLEEDFKGNKAAQPATVVLSARDKKYPFYASGITANLGLRVENLGPGYANETKLEVLLDESLRLCEDVENVITPGRLLPNERVNIDIPVQVVEPTDVVTIYCEVSWRDFDRTKKTESLAFTLAAQQAEVDWTSLVRRDPYSLEPVETEVELVGRKDALNRLIGTFDSKTVGSALVHGQKRVGKTSIAKTIAHELEKRGFLAVYLEQGDYIDPDPRKTVAKLGERLCKILQRKDSRIKHLSPPVFVDALAPLAEFIDDVSELLGNRRILFILDEFDELPPELYSRDELGDALFMTLRSLSSRSSVGFLLVGGEKMAYVSNTQGSKLNKWKDEKVDYFSRETEWGDYCDLVTRPVLGSLEYAESALECLYRYTAGNPFFTKQLCGYVLQIAAERRDCYVTEDEVMTAVGRAVNDLSVNAFQHFWDDGIIDSGDVYLEKTTRRRKILIGTAITLEKVCPATLDAIRTQPMLNTVPYLENGLREFVNRKVLMQPSGADSFEFFVQLFYRWLQNKGINELISKFPDPDLNMRGIQADELLRITSSEIVELTDRWETYKGQKITDDRVRAWLAQFGGPREQRLMFRLLQGTTFFTQSKLRSRMKEVHEIVRQGLLRNLGKEKKPTKYSEILIGYLDGPDKSGARFAKLYADVAGVYVDNVVEKSGIVARLESDSNVQALVFVDDFVGTGNAASGHLKELAARLSSVVDSRATPLRIIFTAVVAYEKGWAVIQEAVKALPIEITVHTCEILDESYRCFEIASHVFPEPTDREAAKEIALTFGKKLEKNTPLGYGGLGLAVVFEDNCPNNSLPILRSDSAGWKPLFKRS